MASAAHASGGGTFFTEASAARVARTWWESNPFLSAHRWADMPLTMHDRYTSAARAKE